MKAAPFLSVGAALALSLTGACGGDAHVIASKPPLLRIVGPNNVSWTPGFKFPVPMGVRLETAEGAQIAGTSVLWSVASGGGIIGGEDPAGNQASGKTITLPSDANGYSSVLWTLGAQVGEQKVTASVSGFLGSPAVFTIT